MRRLTGMLAAVTCAALGFGATLTQNATAQASKPGPEQQPNLPLRMPIHGVMIGVARRPSEHVPQAGHQAGEAEHVLHQGEAPGLVEAGVLVPIGIVLGREVPMVQQVVAVVHVRDRTDRTVDQET